MCLSASPSNARIIETAARMARAFDAQFTALYVSTPDDSAMTEEDKARLRSNIALSEQCGATVATVYGDDVSSRIAEYARLSRVTKVVLGRSSVKRRLFGNKPLTDKLTEIAPDIEVHIIPDVAADTRYTRRVSGLVRRLLPDWKAILITVGVLAAATGVGMLFAYLHLTEANIIAMYVLSVLITAICAKNYVCDVVSAIADVLVYNVLFVEPRFSLRVSEVGTYVTFLIMLIASLITGALAHRLQYTAEKSARSAYRTKVLFDTDRLLRQQTDPGELLDTTARQLVQLLDRDVVVLARAGGVAEPFFTDYSDGKPFDTAAAMQWLADMQGGGDMESEGVLYSTVAVDDRVYGAVGVRIGNRPVESLEKSIFQSVVGECALAMDNVHSRQEKEQASLDAQREQMRANMLRAISHDLRTPLTAIAGNADFLLNSPAKPDEDTLRQLLSDIYDDSMWLYALVENLLAVTRLNGAVQLNFTCESAEELIDGAMKRLHRRSDGYTLTKRVPDSPIIVKVDTRLILQVLVNLVDNALKYTPPGSHIVLSVQRTDEGVEFCVADDGAGIPDELKEKVFEMFYTGDNGIADSRRSLGLGLALCRTIVEAHGGRLNVLDNEPHGAVFRFVLPEGEVTVNE